ncbi:MAG: hypothetical protein A2X28_10335 [Elusimicrobia bacterium GWA2_56_46]|nr:MAG: hypothetical protein A2X28_10335 [Elusimicrobia bacterium GWA2_56_46]OGR55981.1 MAG: hypothetical protein A2X39_05285 [Elusimicrobia bacterium GWC2_56_31]HBB65939.1 hypothetical protein [Elusimicrobiota bacterium]HBW22364.1 hypothetical protein [Elusimicrobiota bacterium]
MAKLILTALVFFLAQDFHAGAQKVLEKRVDKLENRVDGVEKRVTGLEESRTPGAGRENIKIQPLSVVLISKKHAVFPKRIGIDLTLEFRNLTSYDINGFSGTLVFKPEGGEIYTRKMSYSHPIESGGTAQIELTISSSETKRYLKFIKATAVKVVLINQKLF